MLICLVSSACAAPNAGSTNTVNNNIPVKNWGSDGSHGKISTATGQNVQLSNVNIPNSVANSANMATNAAVSNAAVSFTGIPTSGNAIDNTKKVAVYMAPMTNPIHSESTAKDTTVAVTFDPLVTSMFYEYNPSYISDSNIGTLTIANYAVLIVPMSQMSTAAANQIQAYINSGGCVWFLNDPCLAASGAAGVQLTGLLGNTVSATTSSATAITVVNDGAITNGIPASFKPIGTTSKSNVFRSLTGSGTISGLNYQVLMSSGTSAMLVKFENTANGARVIYSNPNMFISGGTSSYFNAQTGTQLFSQAKAWLMKLALNQNGVSVTYPNSDKQLTVTCDDVTGADWEGTTINPMITAEKNAGITTPSILNTFFVIPESDTSAAEMAYYTSNGDTHTLHPHVTADGYGYVWDNTATTLATYTSDIATSKGVVNKAVSGNAATNYGYTAWRFPMTTYCLNAMQAVSNSGFAIESSTGIGTDGMAPVGNSQDNTILLPKQMLIGNVKANLIEMEMPAPFDIDSTASGQFYTNNNAFTNQFKGINFPSNFVVGGHYQGIGTGGLSTWGVKVTGLDKELGQVITAEKAANPNYANFNTLANYLTGVKTATITGTSSSGSTVLSVTNSKPITDFTLKVALGGVTGATCDGAACTVKTDALTGAIYITKTIAAGTHNFAVTTTGGVVPPTNTAPVANFAPLASTGTGSVSVTFTSSSTGSPAPTCSWNFGDGSAVATGNSVTHVFTNTGTTQLIDTVTLTATNSVSSSTKTGTVTINPTTVAPAANFAPLATTGNGPLSVTFTSSCTGNPAPTCSWNFGDGSAVATGNSVTHQFTNTGTAAITRTVTLTASSTAGTSTKTGTVTINPTTTTSKPTIVIAPTTATITAGSSVSFTATVGGNPAPTVSWNFGDSTAAATGTAVSHVFTNAGTAAVTRTVTATATNSAGSTSATAKITVNPSTVKYTKPAAYFTCSATSGTTATTFTFTPDCDNNPTSFVWNFADGTSTVTTTTQTPVIHKFAKTGSFMVRLDASNPAGTDYDDKTVTIK